MNYVPSGIIFDSDNPSIYWTRQPVLYSASSYAVTSFTSVSTYMYGIEQDIRPTVGVKHDLKVIWDGDLGGYKPVVFAPPDKLYLNGAETDVEDAQPGRAYTFSWPAVQGDNVQYLLIEYTSNADRHEARNWLTGGSSVTITSPPHGYLKCTYTLFAMDSANPFSSNAESRTISTRNSNIQIYGEDGQWYLANVKYYNGSAWELKPGLTYYAGDASQGDGGWIKPGP